MCLRCCSELWGVLDVMNYEMSWISFIHSSVHLIRQSSTVSSSLSTRCKALAVFGFDFVELLVSGSMCF